MRRDGVCLCCKDKRPMRGRGLCDACYEAARRAVIAGETTWAALEKKKLARPGIMSAFRQALSRSRK